MSRRVIPLADHRTLAAPAPVPAVAPAGDAPAGPPRDRLDRPLRDLRISVTDRCNFRCGYCMPREVFDKHHAFLPQRALLSFEEIERTARAFAGLGVEKLRLTGGEPLLRRGIESLVGMLAAIRTPAGEPLDLTLTTNGSLLARKAAALADAGLRRVTVSLDALDDATFRRMNDADFPVADVLDGIDAALAAGLAPLKVNMVVQKGVNDHAILPMARHFRALPVDLRFIEFMDVGESNGWRLDDVVPSSEVLARIGAAFPLVPLGAARDGETAERFGYAEAGVPGRVGTISSVTRAFCRDCNRARLSTDGKLYTCLFGSAGHDLRALLRGGADDAALAGAIAAVWRARDDRYSELRAADAPAPAGARERRVEMHYIGG
jgi:cyclic pyranopterin phosphate synthase